MIRLFKIEDPRAYTDFANDLFTGGSRIQQFDYPNDAVQIADVWYVISSAVILKNEDVAKPLSLNVINQWVDLSNLQNIGQLHDLGMGAMAKTDTTNNIAGDRNEFRFLKGYGQVVIDTTIHDNQVQLLPQLEKTSFLIDSLSWVRVQKDANGIIGDMLFSNIDGDGPEAYSIFVNNKLEVCNIYIPSGYNQKRSIDLDQEPWTATINNPSFAVGHKIILFFEGKLFTYIN
jgi:hypothetical protein